MEIGPDTILFEGCDYNHWLITIDFPKDKQLTSEEMVETYVQTAAKVFGSVEEAKKKIYACSTTTYQGFQVECSEETSEKFRDIPGVVFILPDSYIDPVNKEYGGDKYINGTIIPRPPPIQYRRQDRRPRRYDDRGQNYGPPQQDYGPPRGPPNQQNFGPPRGPSNEQSYGPPQGPPNQQGYGPPQGPSSQRNYGPPQGPPAQQSYGSPQGPPSQPSYGSPQGPPSKQNYGPPQGPPTHQNFGPPPQGPPTRQNFGPPQGPPNSQSYSPPQGPPSQQNYDAQRGPQHQQNYVSHSNVPPRHDSEYPLRRQNYDMQHTPAPRQIYDHPQNPAPTQNYGHTFAEKHDYIHKGSPFPSQQNGGLEHNTPATSPVGQNQYPGGVRDFQHGDQMSHGYPGQRSFEGQGQSYMSLQGSNFNHDLGGSQRQEMGTPYGENNPRNADGVTFGR